MKPQQFVKLLRLACDKRAGARDRSWAMSQAERYCEEFQFKDLAAAINETAVDNSRRLRAKMKGALAHLYGRTAKTRLSPKRLCRRATSEADGAPYVCN